jgi:hypothetical protein
MTDRPEHSSLSQFGNNYGRKEFYSTCPAGLRQCLSHVTPKTVYWYWPKLRAQNDLLLDTEYFIKAFFSCDKFSKNILKTVIWNLTCGSIV